MEDYLCLRCSHPMRCHGPGVSSCPATARPVCDLFKPTPSTRLTGGNARDVGRKDDKGKLRWGLVLEAMPKAIEAVVRLAEFGATRYGDHNWKQVDDPKRRYREALYRHTSALAAGEWLDADSGLPTLACIAWNALVLLEFGQ